MGADAVVGNAQRHPYGALPSRSFANNLHNPCLVGVAHRDALTTAVVAILLHQACHAGNRLAGSSRALQCQPHQAEIVQQTLTVDQLQPTIKRGFDNSDLPLIHQPDHIISIVHLLHIATLVGRTPAVDGDLLAFGMASGRAVEQRAGEAETVAVVTAHYTPILRGLLAHNQVGARHGRHPTRCHDQYKKDNLLHRL